MTLSTSTPPSIYVACLAAYNNGYLHGAWIDCDQDEDTVQEEIQAMLKASPIPDAEEYAIHDYQGFDGIQISEYESIETVINLAAIISEHGEAYAAYIEDVGIEYANVEDFEDRYRGEADSEIDFVQDLLEESGELQQWLDAGIRSNFIDWDAIANDYFIDDFSSRRKNGTLYIFSRQ